jgi:hypothetical protein
MEYSSEAKEEFANGHRAADDEGSDKAIRGEDHEHLKTAHDEQCRIEIVDAKML